MKGCSGGCPIPYLIVTYDIREMHPCIMAPETTIRSTIVRMPVTLNAFRPSFFRQCRHDQHVHSPLHRPSSSQRLSTIESSASNHISTSSTAPSPPPLPTTDYDQEQEREPSDEIARLVYHTAKFFTYANFLLFVPPP